MRAGALLAEVFTRRDAPAESHAQALAAEHLRLLDAGAYVELEGSVRRQFLEVEHTLPRRRGIVATFVALHEHHPAPAPPAMPCVVLDQPIALRDGARTRGIRRGDPVVELRAYARDARGAMERCALFVPVLAYHEGRVDGCDASACVTPSVKVLRALSRAPPSDARSAILADAIRLATIAAERYRGTPCARCETMHGAEAREQRYRECMLAMNSVEQETHFVLECASAGGSGACAKVLVCVQPSTPTMHFVHEVVLDEQSIRAAWLFHMLHPLDPDVREAVEIGPYFSETGAFVEVRDALAYTVHACGEPKNILALEELVRPLVVERGYSFARFTP